MPVKMQIQTLASAPQALDLYDVFYYKNIAAYIKHVTYLCHTHTSEIIEYTFIEFHVIGYIWSCLFGLFFFEFVLKYMLIIAFIICIETKVLTSTLKWWIKLVNGT